MIIVAQRIPDNKKIHHQDSFLIHFIFHFICGKLNILKLNYTKDFINLRNTICTFHHCVYCEYFTVISLAVNVSEPAGSLI